MEGSSKDSRCWIEWCKRTIQTKEFASHLKKDSKLISTMNKISKINRRQKLLHYSITNTEKLQFVFLSATLFSILVILGNWSHCLLFTDNSTKLLPHMPCLWLASSQPFSCLCSWLTGLSSGGKIHSPILFFWVLDCICYLGSSIGSLWPHFVVFLWKCASKCSMPALHNYIPPRTDLWALALHPQ